MASSVVLSDDAKTLTIVLRDDLKWHDGQPITSAEVSFSAMEVWKKFHSRGRSTYAALERVDTPDIGLLPAQCWRLHGLISDI